MRLLFLTIVLLVNYVASSPYTCCRSLEEPIIKNQCANGTATKAGILCGDSGAFVVQKDLPGDAYTINEDDELHMSTVFIPKQHYCIGKMEINAKLEDVAIVCFDLEQSENKGSPLGAVATSVCCILSTIFLLLTLLVYLILPELRDLQGKILISLMLSLLMAFIFLATVQLFNDFGRSTCVTMASLLYFWFLCVFFWLNVVSFNGWRSVRHPKWNVDKKKLLICYNAYGWGGPITMLIITMILHHAPGSHMQPGFGLGRCWFVGTTEIWTYFYGPISVLLLSNIIMFISTAWTLWKDGRTNKEHTVRSQKFKFLLYLKLFFIMGICWTFEPLSMVFTNYNIWIVTDYINALQGILIFLLLVVFRKRVRRALARRGLCCSKYANTWATMKDEECEELEEDEEECSLNTNVNNVTFNELQNS